MVPSDLFQCSWVSFHVFDTGLGRAFFYHTLAQWELVSWWVNCLFATMTFILATWNEEAKTQCCSYITYSRNPTTRWSARPLTTTYWELVTCTAPLRTTYWPWEPMVDPGDLVTLVYAPLGTSNYVAAKLPDRGCKPQKMHSGWSAHPIWAPCQLARPPKKVNSNLFAGRASPWHHGGTTAWYKKPSCSESVSDDGETRFTGDIEEIEREYLHNGMRIAPLQHYLSCALALDTGHLSSYSRLLFCVERKKPLRIQ